jgi:hypothetical protein
VALVTAAQVKIVALLNLKTHAAISRGACIKIRRRRKGAADAAIMKAINDILRQDILQVVVWDRFSAIWA